ncbi:hypothetical protein D9M69_586210 [compost metagenome]
MAGLLLWTRVVCWRGKSVFLRWCRSGRLALRFRKAIDGCIGKRHVNARFRIKAEQTFHIQCFPVINHVFTSQIEVANFDVDCKSAAHNSGS